MRPRTREPAAPQGEVLVFWECYRPHEVHVRMLEAVPNPDWVARPGSFARSHEARRSVDVTIASPQEQWPPARRVGGVCLVDMGTDFDDFSPRALAFATEGISAQAQANRADLRAAQASGRSMATGSVCGSMHNAVNIKTAPSTPSASGDSRNCLAGPAWDTLADRWEEGFSHLLGYVERHGHARVPQSYKVDGFNLGLWVSEQRTRYGKSVLNPDRQRRLKDLPGWTWNAARTMEAIERHSDKRLVP